MRLSRCIPAAVALLAALVLAAACGSSRPAGGDAGSGRPAAGLDGVADDYVRLVLAIGQHDGDYVDAYYGPPEWKAAAAREGKLPLAELRARADRLLARTRLEPSSARRTFLEKQLVAVGGFLRRLAGERLTLAEEAAVLLDIAPPACVPAALEAARSRLDGELPGVGTLAARVQAARARVEVPREKLAAVVDAALAETRRRTVALLALPAGERFRIAFVSGKPWGAYNWYEGGMTSLIEVNTDLPKTLDSVLATLAHEGYPGHHVYNALLEQRLVRERGWREYTVYPLYSPQSLIAEGTANVGVDIIFSTAERVAFLRDVLAPLAGVDPLEVERWERVSEAVRGLRCADGEAARMLLDENRPAGEVEAFLVRFGSSPERAHQDIAFIRTYRAYVFNYTAGEDLVAAFVGAGADRAARFFELLQRPAVPSELAAEVARRGHPAPAAGASR